LVNGLLRQFTSLEKFFIVFYLKKQNGNTEYARERVLADLEEVARGYQTWKKPLVRFVDGKEGLQE
jgi:hypothetical protein